jgi:MOSC domain-containing protein YiiM
VDGIIEKIYIAPQGGVNMQAVGEAEALAGSGLRGDRYCQKSGYWSGVDECQVTLIEMEHLEEIGQESGIQVANGEHRRNLVTRGIRLAVLAGKQFQAGEAVLEFDRPRPPCGYIETITEWGMTRALLGRGGICARIMRSGLIRINDPIVIL